MKIEDTVKYKELLKKYKNLEDINEIYKSDCEYTEDKLKLLQKKYDALYSIREKESSENYNLQSINEELVKENREFKKDFYRLYEDYDELFNKYIKLKEEIKSKKS